MTPPHHVAVIGAGVIGLAVARELGRAGVTDVVVLEGQAAHGTGSTSKANGGVRAQFTTPSNIEFSLYTIRELEKLQEETDGLPGLIQAGYLFITGSEAGEERLRKARELQRSSGVAVDWLSPQEVLEKAPFVRADGIRGGTFCGSDGFIDPHGVTQALYRQVREMGIEVRCNSEVTGLSWTGERFDVETMSGPVRARYLVNAAGPFAANVAALLEVELPCLPVRRNMACTDRVDGYPAVIPMCIDCETGVLIRRETGGFLIAWSDPEDPPGFDTSVDPLFLPKLAERIGNRFPFLEEVAIGPRNCWAGLYPETPDHHAIVGPTPGFPAFLQCVGFGGHGIMHSLAAARAISEIVTHGRSVSLDVEPLRFSRFAEGDLIVEGAVL